MITLSAHADRHGEPHAIGGMAERLNAFRAAQPRVVVFHCLPRDTRLDQAKPGLHFGSEAVRTFLEEQQPEYFFCGHIHEAEGQTERMGRTLGVNVGKQGYLLELE